MRNQPPFLLAAVFLAVASLAAQAPAPAPASTPTAAPAQAQPSAPIPRYEVKLSRRAPAVGAVWKANFNRWDGVQPARRMSIWSDPQNTTAWPHVPARFGELVFVE